MTLHQHGLRHGSDKEWFEVPGYDAILITKNSDIWSKWFKRERSLSVGNHGYYVISIKSTPVLVHRLIAITFIPNPLHLPCINHKNGIRTDNRIENLEWCTHRENNLHAYKELGKKPNMSMLGVTGAKNKKSIPILQIKDGVVLREWASSVDAAKSLGKLSSDITQCCRNGRGRLTAYGFEWQYKNK